MRLRRILSCFYEAKEDNGAVFMRLRRIMRCFYEAKEGY